MNSKQALDFASLVHVYIIVMVVIAFSNSIWNQTHKERLKKQKQQNCTIQWIRSKLLSVHIYSKAD